MFQVKKKKKNWFNFIFVDFGEDNITSAKLHTDMKMLRNPFKALFKMR